MRDSVYNSVRVLSLRNLAAINTETTTNSTALDLAQFKNYARACTFLLQSTTITDGTYTFAFEESDNNSDWTTVPTANIQGTVPTWTGSNDNAVAEVGVIPGKRYVRVGITSVDTSSGGIIGVLALVGDARRGPIARA